MKILKIFLISFGTISIIFNGLIWLKAKFWEGANNSNIMPSDALATDTILSPDKKHKVVIFNQNGGGAISPYCFDFVTIVPANLTNSNAWLPKYFVFTASCGAINIGKSKNDIQWNSPTNIQIAFDPTIGASNISEMKLKGHSFDAQIHVKYTLKN